MNGASLPLRSPSELTDMVSPTVVVRTPGLWKRGALWLLFLGPFFFISYGFANWISSLRSNVGIVVFDWETSILLLPWTIIPYWSIDLLYGLSFLLPATRREMDRHAFRLLTVQIVCVTCFLLWPLTVSFNRPDLPGVFGGMFDLLMGFDKPFNQAPSLHIALLVVLWVRFAAHTTSRWQPLLHIWFALIALSVLTTWQHHFIDLPTGALVGFLSLWLWPIAQPSPLTDMQLTHHLQRRRLALRYLLGSALLVSLAFTFGGAVLWLLWPAVSLLIVSLNYLVFGAQGFQKQENGALTPGAWGLLSPYLLGAWINSRLWTYRAPKPVHIIDNVWLGRIPTKRSLSKFNTLVDLCAELPINPHGKQYRSFPVLDLTAPSRRTCYAAAHSIEEMRQHGPVLVYCALGYSRSATAVAAWLLETGRNANLDEALACIRQAHPNVVLKQAHREVLSSLDDNSEVTANDV